MATRKKRAKSLEDLRNQESRIAELLDKRRREGGDEQILTRRLKAVENATQRYFNNIRKTAIHQKDMEEHSRALRERNYYRGRGPVDKYDAAEERLDKAVKRVSNRKYVDYTTDKARAASNG
jgi:hypothetical protein